MPALSNVLVADPPKYALSNTERRVVEAFVRVSRPVRLVVPVTVRLPTVEISEFDMYEELVPTLRSP